MKLSLLGNLLIVLIAGVLAVSCLEVSNEDFDPPTKAEELELLSEYIDTLENRGIDVDTTDLGVYYIIDSIGEGVYPVDGDTCRVKYTGLFMDWSVFDSSGDYTYDVVLGTQSVIEGWEDGLKVFNKGSEGYLIIPSDFAYGSKGYASIPPYTTLIFYINMVEIKPSS